MRHSVEGAIEEASAEYRLFVGIAIAADTFTAAWLAAGGEPTAPYTGDQTPLGYAALRRRLQATAVPPAATLVVLEATGNYWVSLAVALHEAGYPVALVNPLQAHLCWLIRSRMDTEPAQGMACTRPLATGSAGPTSALAGMRCPRLWCGRSRLK